MGIEWHTKKINIQRYYKAIQRTIILNFGRDYWIQFKKTWTVHIIPVSESEKYRHFFDHLKIEKFSEMAWGVTGDHVAWFFVTDTVNPRIFMQNVPPMGHEILHIGYQDLVGTSHIKRRFTVPDGKEGQMGPAATVIPHDIWYGSKQRIKIWIWYGVPPWVPLTIPYANFEEIKTLYNV